MRTLFKVKNILKHINTVFCVFLIPMVETRSFIKHLANDDVFNDKIRNT
jgi:hypothetical protein